MLNQQAAQTDPLMTVLSLSAQRVMSVCHRSCGHRSCVEPAGGPDRSTDDCTILVRREGHVRLSPLVCSPLVCSAWALMLAIAICCNVLIGYCIRRTGAEGVVFLVLTLVVAISFFLIADIDSPRWGIIRVVPQNLTSLAQSLHPK